MPGRAPPNPLKHLHHPSPLNSTPQPSQHDVSHAMPWYTLVLDGTECPLACESFHITAVACPIHTLSITDPRNGQGRDGAVAGGEKCLIRKMGPRADVALEQGGATAIAHGACHMPCRHIGVGGSSRIAASVAPRLIASTSGWFSIKFIVLYRQRRRILCR